MLNLGDFDGVFINVEGGVDVAKGFGRYFVGQFGKFAAVRHLISGREDLITNMNCAGYALKQDTPTKLVFVHEPLGKRRSCAGKFACKIRNSQIRLLAPSRELWQSTCSGWRSRHCSCGPSPQFPRSE